MINGGTCLLKSLMASPRDSEAEVSNNTLFVDTFATIVVTIATIDKILEKYSRSAGIVLMVPLLTRTKLDLELIWRIPPHIGQNIIPYLQRLGLTYKKCLIYNFF
jgi:hypothetical protein